MRLQACTIAARVHPVYSDSNVCGFAALALRQKREVTDVTGER